MVDKSVHSNVPGRKTQHLDLAGARAQTLAEAAGQPSDYDADEGVASGGWTNNVDGSQAPSEGVNAGPRRGPASSNANQVRPGGGYTP
jgi:hypothetical protein